jgi:hypothetical protein
MCTAIAITLLYRFYPSKTRADDKTVAAVADEVYEAVVRDMVAPTQGQSNLSQLVFDDTVLTDLTAGLDIKSCKEGVRKRLLLESNTPPFNSLADKIYRALTRSQDDGLLRADTIQDFLDKSCTVGRLSETFHTDLPQTFIPAESVHFDSWPIEKGRATSFELLFPGASGIISFSHVGFDSTLDEAIVSTVFVCGPLCGTSWRCILKKEMGRWEVTNKLILWVS